MDWLYILMPIAGVKIFWPGLIILGIGVGIIGGFLGGFGRWNYFLIALACYHFKER